MNKNINEKGDLKFVPLLLCGGALFSMHFGASSMVWPMNWGKESGSSVLLAFAGAFITSLLLVVIGYMALAKGRGSYGKMASRIVGNRFGRFYTCLTIAVLGPFYAIPRMSAASWDSIVQAFGLDPMNKLPLIIFTIIFYIITYFFLVNPGKAMDKISSMLFPLLIITVVAIVGKGIISPIAEPVAKSYAGSAFAYGFTNGYATAEILCALIFGVVILNTLKNKGVSESHMTKNMIRVGIIGIAMLTCTHLAHMVIGAYTGGTLDLNYTALYTAVAAILYGKYGGMLFAVALFLAALTTAIGMTSGCAEFFVDITDKKFSYKQCSIVILVFSIIFGSLGLTSMLSWLGPILDGIYPTAIILVLYYGLSTNAMHSRHLYACRWAMYVSFALGAADMIWKYFIKFDVNPGGICDLYLNLPFASVSMAWVPWTILAFIIGWFTYKGKDVVVESDVQESVSQPVAAGSR
jgi:LIVCS family branched-chain amino acid:cation transporter